jgi:hypothetical protein
MPDQQLHDRLDNQHVHRRTHSGGLLCNVVQTCNSDASVASSLSNRASYPSSVSAHEQPDVVDHHETVPNEAALQHAQYPIYDFEMSPWDKVEQSTIPSGNVAGPPQLPLMTVPPPPPPAPWQYLKPAPLSWQANLPPPPPFGSHEALSALSAHRSDVVDDLEQEQDDLRDSRDEVLGARFRLQASRRELSDLRQESGAKDGSTFSMMRRLLLDNGVEAPQDFEQALDEASKLRDRLGLVEANYEEAESRYNTMEWKYTRKESEFLEKLLENDFVPAARSEHKREDPETAELTVFAGEHHDQLQSHDAAASSAIERVVPLEGLNEHEDFLVMPQRAHSSVQIPTSVRSRSDTLPTMKSSLLTQSLPLLSDLDSDLLAMPPPLLDYQISAPVPTRGRDMSTDAYDKNNAESEQERPRLHIVEKMHRVDDWLLDIVARSRLQRAQFKALHSLDFLADDSWWPQAKRYWHHDVGALSLFHTGDSTVPSDTIEQPEEPSVTETPKSVHSAFRVSEAVTTLGRDNPPDAFFDRDRTPGMNESDFKQFKLNDDLSYFPEEKNHNASNLSVSTGLTPSRRTSASAESCNTDTSLESQSERQGCVLVAIPRGARRVEKISTRLDDRAGTITQDGRDLSSTRPEQSRDEHTSTVISQLTNYTHLNLVDQDDRTASSTGQPLRSDPVRSSDNIDESGHLDSGGPHDMTCITDPCLVPLPPSPDSSQPTITCVDPGDDSRCPFLQALKTEKQSPSPSPFLRLTPRVVDFCTERDRPLGSIVFPFVSHNNKLLKLPGPDPEDMYY